MHLVEEHYYTINKTFLKVLGIWPHDKSRLVFFQRVLFVTLAVTYIVLQIKIFFEWVRYEWTTLKTTDEIDILRKYADFSKRFVVTMTVFLIIFLNFFGLFQFLPNFLDIIVPLNESRERHFSFLAEYFVDQKRYFYPILTHNLLAIYIGGTTVISTGTMLMGFIFHICAMLQIASYRLEHVSDNIPLVSKSDKDYIIRKRIINAVDIHRRALEFAEFMLSSFANFYFTLIGIGISSLTVNMFQIHVAVVQSTCNSTEIVIVYNANLLERPCTESWWRIRFSNGKLYLGRIAQMESAIVVSYQQAISFIGLFVIGHEQVNILHDGNLLL
ncbi:PREDICTED: uncharacterized protein LOC108771066 [Trachymyrmex cornetzi]|uniref:uncharacterized protein LOC108771066 n=1 Tax=Trachymyrmex cornetzi TaxID=471704 RepID=UPI00084EF29C|nr:PREDICTED: uncharacterized protein LOC108771066 [Trachymyrmex cornetzi]